MLKRAHPNLSPTLPLPSPLPFPPACPFLPHLRPPFLFEKKFFYNNRFYFVGCLMLNKKKLSNEQGGQEPTQPSNFDLCDRAGDPGGCLFGDAAVSSLKCGGTDRDFSANAHFIPFPPRPCRSAWCFATDARIPRPPELVRHPHGPPEPALRQGDSAGDDERDHHEDHHNVPGTQTARSRGHGGVLLHSGHGHGRRGIV